MICKRLIFTVFAVFLGVFAFSQDRSDLIRIDLNEYSLEQIAKSGVDLDHAHPHGDHLDRIYGDYDRSLLDKAGISFTTVVEDYPKVRGQELKEKMDKLRRSGYSYDIQCTNYLQKHGYNGRTKFEFGSMGGFLTYDELLAELDEMRAAYPDLISARTPISNFQTYEGRPIYSIKISDRVNVNENEKRLLVTGLHHAREPISMQQCVYTMWYLLDNYGSDPLVTDILDNLELYFVPCVNPDGYLYNESVAPNGGGDWRKNRRLLPSGNVGVDINRNYGYQWGFSTDRNNSDSPNSITYRGPAPFSEAETQAIKYLCEQVDFEIALNYHSHGDFLIRPWGYSTEVELPDTDARLYDRLLYELTLENRFASGTGAETVGYVTNGDSDDWMYGDESTKGKIYAMTPELGHPEEGNFWPDPELIEIQCAKGLIMNLKACRFLLSDVEIEVISEEAVGETDFRSQIRLHWLTMDDHPTGIIKYDILSDNIATLQHAQSVEPNVEGHNHLTELNVSTTLKNPDDRDVGEYVDVQVTVTEDLNQREIVNQLRRVYYPSYLREDLIETNTSVLRGGSRVEVEGDWDVIKFDCYSFPDCLSDSPFGHYDAHQPSSMVFDGPIRIPGNVEEAKLNFKMKWELTNDAASDKRLYDYFRVLVSTDGGASYSALCGKHTVPNASTFNAEPGEPVYIGTQEEWVLEEIDLSLYQGQDILLKFDLKSQLQETSNGLIIDDVYIDAYNTKTSTADVLEAAHSLDLYPNPVPDVLELSFGDDYDVKRVSQVSLQNAIGQTVYLDQNVSRHMRIDVSDLPVGMYFVKLQLASGDVYSEKVIVQ